MSILVSPSLHVVDSNPRGARAVLFLHGLGADSESWLPQQEALNLAGVRSLAVDLPGFGRSPLPAEADWSLSWAARQVSDWIRSNLSQPVVVVGLSLGGVVAQQLALDSPHVCRGLVLVSTFSRLRPKRWNELAYLAARFAAANLRGVNSQANSVAWRVFPRPEQAGLRAMLVEKIHHADPRAYQSAMRSLLFFNSRKRLKEIHIPVLVISGTQDTTVPVENQMDLLRDIPGAKHVLIEGANHAVNIDQPEEFNRALLEFLAVLSD